MAVQAGMWGFVFLFCVKLEHWAQGRAFIVHNSNFIFDQGCVLGATEGSSIDLGCLNSPGSTDCR